MLKSNGQVVANFNFLLILRRLYLHRDNHTINNNNINTIDKKHKEREELVFQVDSSDTS
jgi:hypothetical protein